MMASTIDAPPPLGNSVRTIFKESTRDTAPSAIHDAVTFGPTLLFGGVMVTRFQQALPRPAQSSESRPFDANTNAARTGAGMRLAAPRTLRQITSLSARSSAASSLEKSSLPDLALPHAVFTFTSWISTAGLTALYVEESGRD